MGAVIDERAYRRLKDAIAIARTSEHAEILLGGGCDDSEGWFVEPTLVRTTDPRFDLMQRELFGPLLCAYVYPDDRYDEILELANDTSPYALTGLDLRARARRDRARPPRAALRGGQLLRQRQADRRRRRAAAVRRRRARRAPTTRPARR